MRQLRQNTQEEQAAIAAAQQEILKHHPDGKKDGKTMVFQQLAHSLRRDPAVTVVFASDSYLDDAISVEIDLTTNAVLNYNETPE